jgi:hypothetical protein
MGNGRQYTVDFSGGEKKGVSDRVLARLQTVKSEEKQVDWEIHLVDGSVVRAHQHAAGKKVPPKKKL